MLLVALALLAAVGIGYTAIGLQLNQYASDSFFRVRGQDMPAVDQIALVTIDDETINQYGNLPLERAVVATALKHICDAHPKVIGLDLLFSAPTNPDNDQALARALEGCPVTVLATNLAQEDITNLQAGAWADPLAEFAKFAAGVGHVHADADVDGVVRQILLAKNTGQEQHWALALEMFRVQRHVDKIFEPDDHTLVVGQANVPAQRQAVAGPGGVTNQRPLVINYAGGEGTFPHYSFRMVANNFVSPDRFADKAVLLGVTAQAAGDRKFTPLSTLGRDMPGVEIHANALRTLISGRFLLPLRDSTSLLVMIGIAVVVAVLLLAFRGWGLAITLLLGAFLVHAVPYFLFSYRQLLAPAFSFAAAFWGPLVVGGVFQYLTVWRSYQAADASHRRLRGGLEMVAHEIRSPLTAIQGSAEVISRYPLDDERRKQLGDMVSRESQRVANMVARFLDVERLEAGELELHRTPVALGTVMDHTAERIQPLAARKQIHVNFVKAADAGTMGDAELLEFALYNLVSNAIKYSPEGSSVEVRVRKNTGLGLLFVDVIDQGAGIPKEDQAKIFDRFFRSESAAKSGQPGLGIGLSIVQEIARHHGGSVSLDSAPGRGSKFSLMLPLSDRATQAQA